MTKEDLIELLNEDLALAFRAHVQTVSNVLTFDDESLRAAQESRRDQIKDHVDHTIMLARQVAKLGGLPVA
ncbi:MAG: hypothetical protein KDI19_17500, partial [Pseudomonadales bacterium]|nr:hypothetical protein [Pseudomonadales bacterium]